MLNKMYREELSSLPEFGLPPEFEPSLDLSSPSHSSPISTHGTCSHRAVPRGSIDASQAHRSNGTKLQRPKDLVKDPY